MLMLWDGNATYHNFLTSALSREENFVPTARGCHGAIANIELDACTLEVLNWHYKHSVIMSWGGRWLISYMKDFPIANTDLVAGSVDQEVDIVTSPASSADFPCIWDL